MEIEKIKVLTETGHSIEVVVLNKRADHIEVVIGQGEHSTKAQLTPTRNGLAYVGNVMGREIIYERSREQVQADIDILNPSVRKSRPR
jgi:K+/H+ antiporter YhaU regulatory subunit KhtT